MKSSILSRSEYKIGASKKKLKEAEKLLWLGKVEETIKLLKKNQKKESINFSNPAHRLNQNYIIPIGCIICKESSSCHGFRFLT